MVAAWGVSEPERPCARRVSHGFPQGAQPDLFYPVAPGSRPDRVLEFQASACRLVEFRTFDSCAFRISEKKKESRPSLSRALAKA